MRLLGPFSAATFLVLIPLQAQTSADPPTPAAPKRPAKSEWVFSLLPKSFQKNPRIDLTVITEMTELGRKRPAASPSAPVYYLAQSTGFHAMGHAPANEHPLKPEDVERLLARALATNGFLPAKLPEHPPTLAVFYTWGSHSLLIEGDEENPSLSGEQVTRNLLDRAALVGGAKFSQEVMHLFQQSDDLATLNHAPPSDPTGIVPPVAPFLDPGQLQFMDPIYRYRQADPKNDFLFEQFTHDVYYVVASAYDYASLAEKTRRLYWRTRMTVAAQGVSQAQTMPALILNAAPFFGQDMSEPEILSRRAVPEGQVEIGTPTVVEMPAAEAVKKPVKP